MVDVTEKNETVREATATGKIRVNEEVYRAIEQGTVGKGCLSKLCLFQIRLNDREKSNF